MCGVKDLCNVKYILFDVYIYDLIYWLIIYFVINRIIGHGKLCPYICFSVPVSNSVDKWCVVGIPLKYKNS